MPTMKSSAGRAYMGDDGSTDGNWLSEMMRFTLRQAPALLSVRTSLC